MDDRDLFLRLGVALAAGLLIGLERGWHERGEEGGSGARIVGTRTFALIALAGALSALLARELGGVVLGLALLGFTGLIVVAHVVAARADRDYGVTTIVAALVVFGLGATAIQGYLTVTAAVGVVTATVLGLRRQLHGWEERLERRELLAILQLLLISVVVLPVLPDRGYGPWQALNPYVLWWLVVLMAAVSSLGYFGVKLAGPERGLALTAVFGGLASSTAVTLNFARMGRDRPALRPVLSAGVLIAAGIMFPRMLVMAVVVHPPLAVALLGPLGLMALVAYGWAGWHWRHLRTSPEVESQRFTNPLELRVALQLGALLAAVTVLAHALRAWLGDPGLYLLAGVSAVGDVDALTLSVAGMAAGTLDGGVAAGTVIVAAIGNTLAKGLLAGLVGGLPVARQTTTGLVATAAAGVLGLVLM